MKNPQKNSWREDFGDSIFDLAPKIENTEINKSGQAK
jgi:hypothetical protein